MDNRKAVEVAHAGSACRTALVAGLGAPQITAGVLAGAIVL